MPSKQVVLLPNVKFANLALRALQLLIAISSVAVYAAIPDIPYWGLGIASASVSLLVAAAFALTLLLSDYVWVARAFLIDLILVGLFAIMFARLKDSSDDAAFELMSKVFGMNVVAMLLWSISSLMGIVCLALDRLRGEKAIAYY